MVLSLYLVCSLLVFSFILFEVLDVDASDFPTPAKSTVKLVEPPHDLKRAATTPIDTSPALPVGRPDPDGLPGLVALHTDLASPHARVCRSTLPRALLPDPALSA